MPGLTEARRNHHQSAQPQKNLFPKGTLVNDLLDFVIERHGGIDRWYEASTVSAIQGAARTTRHPLQRIAMTPLGAGSSLESEVAFDRVRTIGSRREVPDVPERPPRAASR